MSKLILSSAYLAPVAYFSAISNAEQTVIEQFDHYRKQTFRNRCTILSANGPIDLVIPVIKLSGQKTIMADVQIDYATSWQNNHWRSIVSAYNSSPFFQYYEPELADFYKKKWKYLLEFNQQLLALVLAWLEIEKKLSLTDAYFHEYSDAIDAREWFSPKKKNIDGSVIDVNKRYGQTFSDKFEFIPGLSIVDLVFNEGPQSLSYL